MYIKKCSTGLKEESERDISSVKIKRDAILAEKIGVLKKSRKEKEKR